jgi:hypothetical protein
MVAIRIQRYDPTWMSKEYIISDDQAKVPQNNNIGG